jgi:hypothetical protein
MPIHLLLFERQPIYATTQVRRLLGDDTKESIVRLGMRFIENLSGIEADTQTTQIDLLPYVSTTLEKNPINQAIIHILMRWDWRKSSVVDFKMGLERECYA